ncbi:uncharacterized protein LOC131061329 isoform X1 [Cryptomeria japonica]|uniref:uncharacterized protein LOC131061329 isoform X1 n=1 Tax=Cryptomeria japonica TaxID=3369 RepID=UPI0025ABF9F6|nr:uncharacterized protein LOC131061329 isoform X1 [Cryptomeria japonica]XP_057850953.1 uncharacterized protein LOC131061329 isoform X1 [Cryptomeria japonica]XP_057850954.1 uncharacterized protein LOC131061329 isoform X1 [Cryptomeria japonica]
MAGGIVFPPESGSVEELREIDGNLGSLCQHIEVEGWNFGAFSDIVIECMGQTLNLHRLILSRSSYFRNMLQGPWKEAGAPVVTLQIDDENVNREAVTMALSYLYGHHPKLNDSNAFRVLAAASFLDLQDLCTICTDFIISDIWSSNFLVYQAFAERQDYGIHGDRVRKACWGYLCRGGAMELRETLPKLSAQTLCTLLTSDQLWVPNEEKRFELALSILLVKGGLLEIHNSHLSNTVEASNLPKDFTVMREVVIQREQVNDKLEHKSQFQADPEQICTYKNFENHQIALEILVELADSVVDFQFTEECEEKHAFINQGGYSSLNAGIVCGHRNGKNGSANKSKIETGICKPHSRMWKAVESSRTRDYSTGIEESVCKEFHKISLSKDQPLQCSSSKKAIESTRTRDYSSNTEESACKEAHKMSLSKDQSQQCSSSKFTSFNRAFPNEWGRYGSSLTPSWGGRVVETKQIKACPKESDFSDTEKLDSLFSIFEGGRILYCHMTFEGMLDVRRQLEELAFLCKSVYDGLWLQMLLRQRVLAIAADTCKTCCLTSQLCTCRHTFLFSQGRTNDSFYRDDQQRNSGAGMVGNIYAGDATGATNGSPVPVRVRVRGAVDGLAGIGRGSTFGPPEATWPPTRVVFSRVPYGLGGRNNQHNLANEQSEGRVDFGEIDLPRDGLTAAVGLGQGTGNSIPIHSDQTPRIEEQNLHCRIGRDTAVATSCSKVAMERVDPQEHPLGREWEASEDSPIALDMRTPLRDFPPFRFGVEFEDVHMLGDSSAKHSPEVFYAGSLWKVSVQAFKDEDPQGRRTLGLFLHRRKAEITDLQQKVHLYTDTREKVTVRYQLICPSKRQVMTFGSLTQAGTLLPKAPKGWGWRTAFLFDDLPDLLQGGSLRVAAVIQIV